MKKYELTDEFIINKLGIKLFRIRSLIQFEDVKIGDLGGYIEKENNLSHDHMAWVYGNAQVYGNAIVSGNSKVSGCAIVYHNAQIYGNAQISGNAQIYGNAQISGDAEVFGDTQIYGNAQISGDAEVFGNVNVSGNSWIFGNAQVSGDAKILGNAIISNDADYSTVKGFGYSSRNTTFFRCKDGKIRVICGCFYGDLNEFREIVKNTHGDTKFAKEYLIIADLMEMHFN